MKVIQELSGLIKWLQSVRPNKKSTTNARRLGSIPIGIFRGKKAPHLIVLCCRLTVIETAFVARYVRLWDAIATRYVRLLRCHCGPIRSVIVTAVVARYVRLLLLPLWPDTFGYWFCRCGPIRSVIVYCRCGPIRSVIVYCRCGPTVLIIELCCWCWFDAIVFRWSAVLTTKHRFYGS